MRILAFAGPPCSGKSTLAGAFAGLAGVPHVSSGALIRSLAEEGDPAGVALYRKVRDGTYAPPEEILELMERRLSQADCANGFVVDGFPRLRVEAEYFLGRFPVSGYVCLTLPEAETTRRSQERGRHDDANHSYRLRLFETEWPSVLEAFTDAEVPTTWVDATWSPGHMLDQVANSYGLTRHAHRLAS